MMKKFSVLMTSAALAAAMSMSAFAAGWQTGADGRWWFAKDNGSIMAATTGWHMDASGNWYMGTDRNQGDNSYCQNGWWWIYDSASQMMKCYYFDAQGYMLVNTTTPDGYQVNEKGEWVKDGAVLVIHAPSPLPVMRADFDYAQYLPGTYEANAAARAQRIGWQRDEKGWWYKNNANGQFCQNGWWWIFDSSVQGMKCYYFDGQGYMLANGTAPDGSQVNANGEWVKDGAVQVVAAPTNQACMSNDELNRTIASKNSISDDSGSVHVVTNRVYGSSGGGSSSGNHDSQDNAERKEDEKDEEEQKGSSGQTVGRADMNGFARYVRSKKNYSIRTSGNDAIIEIALGDSTYNVASVAKNGDQSYLETWNIVKDNQTKLAKILYDYARERYRITGTITQTCVSSGKKVLSFENDRLVYDFVNDSSTQQDSSASKKTGIEGAFEAVTEKMNGLLKGYDADDFKLGHEGDNITITAWGSRYDQNLTKARQDGNKNAWNLTINNLRFAASLAYKAYQNYDLSGSVMLSVVDAGDKSTEILRFVNGQLEYDASTEAAEETPEDEQENSTEQNNGQENGQNNGEENGTQSDSSSEDAADTKAVGEFKTYVSNFYNKLTASQGGSARCSVTSEGENVKVKVWGMSTERTGRELKSGNRENISKWGSEKRSLKSQADSFYRTYSNKYGLEGTFTFDYVDSSDKDTVYLSFENGSCVYDVAEDASAADEAGIASAAE